MNRLHTSRTRRADLAEPRAGSVLVIVLWIMLGLVSITLYFANSMALELRASDNRANGIVADEAIEGAARYVAYVLTTYATNGVMPDLTEYQTEAVPVGDAHFWIIGRDNSYPVAHPERVAFGLVDESSKFNLNTVSTNTLSLLPRMTADVLNGILDWRNPNSNGGTELYYAMAQPPYQRKGAPFESVDELRLVYGTTMDILVGNDINRNGVLDSSEPDEDGNGQVDPGIIDYLTVYSREPNTHSDGTPLVNINNQAQLRALLQSNFGGGRANQIMGRLGFGTATRPGATNAPARATAVTMNGLLQFYLRSGLSEAEFQQIYPDITVGGAAYTQGRVNINTASANVLSCLPGMDIGTAQQVVSYRQSNPNNLGSIAWIVDALGRGSTAVLGLETGDYITTRSFQFTADIAAVGAHGRGYRRVKFIFDISDGATRILYRQDLTRLGWALGQDVRQRVMGQEAS
ncbi:MAG TPA: helix-hairpin-helix domain-containing protein [Verrucomicrobiae bacterium]|nr:helix-hairpin-helix domain-containing protein [Verrucomicrobiae bacterium]